MEAGEHRKDRIEVENIYVPPEPGNDPAMHVLWDIQHPITPEDAFGPDSRNQLPQPEQKPLPEQEA